MSAVMVRDVDGDREQTLAAEFADWLEALDRLVLTRTELSLQDLPDLPFWAGYDAGLDAEAFFDEQVVEHLAEMGWDPEEAA